MLKRIKPAIACVLVIALLGCPSQTTLAALTQTLGSSAASIAEIEGNPSLASKLTSDTTAAVNAINSWKSGTNSQLAVEAINLVIDDLNLICGQVPNCGPYGPLITLALGTAASIITILSTQSTPTGASPAIAAPHTQVHLTKPPASAKEYKADWNALRASSSVMQKAPVLN